MKKITDTVFSKLLTLLSDNTKTFLSKPLLKTCVSHKSPPCKCRWTQWRGLCKLCSCFVPASNASQCCCCWTHIERTDRRKADDIGLTKWKELEIVSFRSGRGPWMISAWFTSCNMMLIYQCPTTFDKWEKCSNNATLNWSTLIVVEEKATTERRQRCIFCSHTRNDSLSWLTVLPNHH